jgi:hypothetical protein
VAAETLALYLHAYGGVSGQEAAAAAGHAVGATPLQDTLRQLLEELALIADGWCRRVTLAWPYGGGKVEVVGEAGACFCACWAACVPIVGRAGAECGADSFCVRLHHACFAWCCASLGCPVKACRRRTNQACTLPPCAICDV